MHKVVTKEGIKHDEKLVHKILSEELEDILKLRKTQITDSTQYSKVADFYKKAFKISQRWIRNYVDLNFASLGSYTRQQLLQIGKNEVADFTFTWSCHNPKLHLIGELMSSLKRNHWKPE